MLADEPPATNYEICLNHGKHNQDLSALSPMQLLGFSRSQDAKGRKWFWARQSQTLISTSRDQKTRLPELGKALGLKMFEARKAGWKVSKFLEDMCDMFHETDKTGRSMLPKRCCVARVSSPDVVAPAQASAAEKVSLETKNKPPNRIWDLNQPNCKTTYKVQSFVWALEWHCKEHVLKATACELQLQRQYITPTRNHSQQHVPRLQVVQLLVDRILPQVCDRYIEAVASLASNYLNKLTAGMLAVRGSYRMKWS